MYYSKIIVWLFGVLKMCMLYNFFNLYKKIIEDGGGIGWVSWEVILNIKCSVFVICFCWVFGDELLKV